MTALSKIEWTDHTFNPWQGCTKVSAGCKHCYAETLTKRWGKVGWGPTAPRVKTSASYWKQPLKWNKTNWFECQECGWRGSQKETYMPEKKNRPCYCPACWKEREVPIAPVQARQRVFCASLADVFEDNPQVGEWRAELFGMIEQTPNLDWLILTKRPEKIVELGALAVVKQFNDWLAGRSNVWIGTTVENQAEAEKRTKELGKVGPCVRFLSIEPMLEDLTIPMIEKWDWVIVGGESGQDFRPFHYQWARSIRDQCQEYGVPFFMKQAGGHPYKRDKLADFPNDLKIRQHPKP